MKKIIYIITLSATLIFWYNISFASEEWREGVITETTATTVTINGETYDIDYDTIVKDVYGNMLSTEVLGQKTCCDNIKFLVMGNSRYIEKIIVDTSKAVM